MYKWLTVLMIVIAAVYSLSIAKDFTQGVSPIDRSVQLLQLEER